ncbi:S-layer homology domain-containing protein [Paenibacillus sp. MWE-103]|uniref:S-layer homology domain-containing protein n=1 Tax=Paenibacillus artemisiicola TaxID=1172618 RepID=A0ABS3W4P2_9BACL|nr:S-layer homology domain-containing protein [Paenibacillus artemisiicola]MBO7743280.1 S-layer homology domain-containing protein [Paenibacillus artemisiicola]
MNANGSFGHPFLALMLIIGMTFGFYPHAAAAATAPAALPYDDIRDNYAASAIVNMTKLGFVTGTGPRRFEPDKAITRAEFTTMLERLLGIRPVSAAIPAFADVPVSAWHYGWVQAAIQLNLVQGAAPSRFEPNRPVTREEAAVLLARAAKQSLPPASSVPDGLYGDEARIDDWALPAVYRLWQRDLMGGDAGGFRPRDAITRQEAAVLLNRTWTHADWAAEIQAAVPSPIQLGWQYDQTTLQYEAQVAKSEANTLSPRWYFLGKTGALEDGTDAALATWAHARGKRVWAMVGNHSDAAATHAMLVSPGKRQAFVQQLADRVRLHGLDGLNLDFENMLPEDRDVFTAFVAALEQALDASNAAVSVNVSPDLGTDWTAVFDYAALANAADYIVLMGYDEHWDGDPIAGSVASFPWVRQGLATLLREAPAGRVILALPLYTRQWTQTGGGSATSLDIGLPEQNALVRAKKLAPRWDDALGQYYAEYADRTRLNRLWLEDGRSLSRKIGLGAANAVAGYGYWYIGGESPDVWTSVRNAIRFDAYTFA